METNFHPDLPAVGEKSANHERRVSEFQDALAQITNTPATVELLRDNAYTERAMSELISLNEQVLQAFKKAGSIEVFTSDKDREDAAFNYFSLPNLAEVLDQVSVFNEKLQQLDRLLQNNNRQDLLIEKVRAVFVPTDEKAINHSEEGKELAPKLLIDRTKAILVALSENFDIDVFDPTQLKITEGEVTDNMIRQTPYRFLDIPTLQRQILVNDEEGNATFVFDSTKLQDLQITSQQLSEAMSKSKLKLLIDQHLDVGQALSYSQNFIERLIKAIEQPASKSRKQKATKENADYLQPVEKVPEGWINISQLASNFGIAKQTMRNALDNLANLETKLYKADSGRITTFYSPTTIEQIKQEFGDFLTTQKAPDGWMNANQLESHLNVSDDTLKKVLDNLTNDSGVLYKTARGQMVKFYSPTTIEQIKQEFGDFLTTQKAPDGWMNAKQLASNFGIAEQTMRNALDNLANLETKLYKADNGRITKFYNPTAIEQIRQELGDFLTTQKAPDGWMNANQLESHLNVSQRSIKKAIVDLQNLENAVYKTVRGQMVNFYSPTAIEQITKKLAEQRENK